MKTYKMLLLSLFFLYSLGLSAKTIGADTLRVIREDEFLRYPFGVLQNFKDLKKRDLRVFNTKTKYIKPHLDDIREQTKSFSVGGSFARFYTDRNTKKLETVNAVLINKELPLQNGVVVGMERAAFLKKFNISEEKGGVAGVIELSSKTGDIHHYYGFQNDRLVRIVILSRLFYQKE